MTQDEQFIDSARAAAPTPANDTGRLQDAATEAETRDDVGSEDGQESGDGYTRVRSSLLSVLLTLGTLLVLILLVANVYQYFHNRSQNTVATVNGAAITQADFDRAAGASDQALQSLIDQKLIQQEAKRQKVVIPDSEVNNEVNTIKQQLGSEAEFLAALQRANLTESQLREQIRTKDLAQAMGAKGVAVSDDEAQTYYNQNKAQFGTQTFDQTKDQVKSQLLQSKQNEAIQTWIAGLRQKAKISIHMPA